MKNRSIFLSLVLVAVIGGCRHAAPVTKSDSEKLGASESSIASAATSKARHWRSDAALVKLEVHIDGVQARKIFTFYSASDASGYIVATGVGPEHDEAFSLSASQSMIPIPADFPDISMADSALRAGGFKGRLRAGTLTAVKLCGLTTMMRWHLVLEDATSKALTSREAYFYADPASGEPPMDWHEADQLADASIKGDNNAWNELIEAAQNGDPNAATNIGYLYAIGTPTARKDYAKAGSYFCVAAFEGSPAAQFDLGLMYEYGYGIGAPSMETSRILFCQAAAQGLSAGESNARSQQGITTSTTRPAFIKARNWNPAMKGAVSESASDYPDRFPPNRWPRD